MAAERVTLTINLTAFVEGMKAVERAMLTCALRAAEGAKRMAEAFAPLLHEIQAKRAHGRGNEDETGLWQSDMCAGWLHDSCPTPARRWCDCTCHGGPLR
jgi:cobalamin-dependent methionine synthase I